MALLRVLKEGVEARRKRRERWEQGDPTALAEPDI